MGPIPSSPDSDREPVPSLPSRLPTKTVLALLGFVGALDLLLLALGIIGSRSMFFLGCGAVLGLGACGFWEIVERRRSGGSGNLGAWLAFPLSLLLAFAQLPFLAMSVYPPLEEALAPPDTVAAFVVEGAAGRRLEIRFPLDMARRGNMLRINDISIAPSYVAAHPEHFTWEGERIFVIALDEVQKDLDTGPVRTVTLNGDLQNLSVDKSLELFRYASAESLPRRVVKVR